MCKLVVSNTAIVAASLQIKQKHFLMMIRRLLLNRPLAAPSNSKWNNAQKLFMSSKGPHHGKSQAPTISRDQVVDTADDLRAINEASHHIAPETDADQQWKREEQEIAELEKERERTTANAKYNSANTAKKPLPTS